MKKISLADILELPISERLQLVDDIWESIAQAPEGITLTDGQRDELERRLAAYHQAPEEGSSWEEVKARILKQ